MKAQVIGAVIAVFAGSTAGIAADLPKEIDAPVAAPVGKGAGYVVFRGGGNLKNELFWIELMQDVSPGWAAGMALGFHTPVPGISAELDILRSKAIIGINDPDEWNSLSVMGNLVATVPLGPVFSVYAGIGTGTVLFKYEDNHDILDGKASGAGYQAFGGIAAEVGKGIRLSLEGRYQATFDMVTLDSGDLAPAPIDFKRSYILAGISFAF